MLRFFALTYALAWTCWYAAAALSDGAFLLTPLLLLGTFAPAIVALGLTTWDEGIAGTREWLRRSFHSPGRARWYLCAVGYWLTIKLAGAVAYRLIAGVWPQFGTTSWFVILVAIVISTPVQAGEELGWRGYALPRSADRFGFARAGLVVGFVWAVWHLPLFLVIQKSGNYGQSFPVFVLGVTGVSVAMTWLYAKTNGSLLLMMLMHSATNQTNGIVPTRLALPGNPLALDTSLITLLVAAFLWVSAAFFLARMPAGSAQRQN